MEEATILASIMDSKEDTKRVEIDERDASRVNEPPMPETVVQSEGEIFWSDFRPGQQQRQQELIKETKPPNDDTMDVDKEDSSEQVSSVEQKNRAELQQQQQQVSEVIEETKPPSDDTMDVDKEDSLEQVTSVKQEKRAELVDVAAATAEKQVIQNETNGLSSEQDKMEDNETTDETSQKKTEEEGEVQVLTPKQAEREWRRKRRRRLYKMLNHKTEKPSFLAILHQPIEIGNGNGDDNDDDDSYIPVTRVVIDVDEYLGLSKLTPPLNVVSSNYPFTTTTTTTHELQTNNFQSAVPTAATSAADVVSSSTTTTTNLVDEGYYEGVKLMGMPEDDIYISELQQWIRQNLEFFSATEMDAQMSQSGRRTRTVRGKVGVRCIHCARELLPKFQSKFSSQGIKNEQWPPGSVSYPATIEGLYSSCSQRPQLHFESCPYLPSNV
jgi:hypothetical protein